MSLIVPSYKCPGDVAPLGCRTCGVAAGTDPRIVRTLGRVSPSKRPLLNSNDRSLAPSPDSPRFSPDSGLTVASGMPSRTWLTISMLAEGKGRRVGWPRPAVPSSPQGSCATGVLVGCEASIERLRSPAMPFLTYDNLDYLARGARRWLYGELRSMAPTTQDEWRGMIGDRTGRAAWLFVFGPSSRGHLEGDEYRLLFSVGVIDSWSGGGRNGWPERVNTIEEHFRRELERQPAGTCDIVVVLLPRNRSTIEGVMLAAAARDPDFKRCYERTRRIEATLSGHGSCDRPLSTNPDGESTRSQKLV